MDTKRLQELVIKVWYVDNITSDGVNMEKMWGEMRLFASADKRKNMK